MTIMTSIVIEPSSINNNLLSTINMIGSNRCSLQQGFNNNNNSNTNTTTNHRNNNKVN